MWGCSCGLKGLVEPVNIRQEVTLPEVTLLIRVFERLRDVTEPGGEFTE